VRDIGIEPVVDGLAPARWNTLGHDLDARTNGVPVTAQLVHEGLELGHDGRVRRKKGILLDVVPGFERNRNGTKLAHVSVYPDAMAALEPFLCDRAGGHGRRSQPGR